MKTIIDNNQRIFLVVDSNGRNYFCNLKDLNTVILENELKKIIILYFIFGITNQKKQQINF